MLKRTKLNQYFLKFSYKTKLKILTFIFFIILSLLLFMDIYCSQKFLKNFLDRFEGAYYQHTLNQLLFNLIDYEIYDPNISVNTTRAEINLKTKRIFENLNAIRNRALIQRILSPYSQRLKDKKDVVQLLQWGNEYLDPDLSAELKIKLIPPMILHIIKLIEEINIDSSILLTFDSGTYAMGKFFGQIFPFIEKQIHMQSKVKNESADAVNLTSKDPYFPSSVANIFSIVVDSFPELRDNDHLKIIDLFDTWEESLTDLAVDPQNGTELKRKIQEIQNKTVKFEEALFLFYEEKISHQLYTYLFLVLISGVTILLAFLASIIAYKKSVKPKAVNMLRDTIHALLSGDTKARIKNFERTAIGEMSRNLNKLATLIDTSFETANKASRIMLDFSREIHETMNLLHANIKSQGEISDKISDISYRLNMAAAEISETLENADKAVSENILAVKQGNENIHGLEMNILHIQDCTDDLLNNLATFQNMISYINKIINLIITVVDQANLLSINSAINAGKAGNEGAGFSIISNQIRELADQSAYFTLDIEMLINTINSELITISSTASTFATEITGQIEDMRVIKELIQKYIHILNEHFKTLAKTRIQIVSKKQIIEKINLLAIHHKDLSNEMAQKSRDIGDLIFKTESLSQEVIKCFKREE